MVATTSASVATEPKQSLDVTASTTPSHRDRYVDFLRAFSILVVVFGHWLMAAVQVHNGEFGGSNVLDVIPGLWIVTWILQVMPLFFFVGGFSNLRGWESCIRRGDSYRHYISRRLTRLMRPTLAFIVLWFSLAVALTTFVPDIAIELSRALAILARPLWFLAVYVLVVALAPFLYRLHRRSGALVPIALAISAAAVDVVRLGAGLTWFGYLNFVFVWLFAHQLGFFYADGSLLQLRPKRLVAWAVGGLALVAALTVFGPYSPSMVGMATEKASNNSPPSVCLAALTVWLVAIALLVRKFVSTRLQRRSVWKGVVAVNSMIMTVFLWHLTALLVAVVVLYPLGFPQPEVGTGAWWALRPIWIVCLTLVLSAFVWLFRSFEHGDFVRIRRRIGTNPDRARAEVALTLIGVVLLILGLSGLAQFGFDLSSEMLGVPVALAATAGAAIGYLIARNPSQAATCGARP
jgi:fucose 4-O-acetylase-like acetyltransferase